MPTADLTLSTGNGSGIVLSPKEKLTYQLSAFLTNVACLIVNPSGIGRCKTTSIPPIFDSFKTFPVRCAPALALLTLGKVNEQISPRFLNRGRPPRLPVLSGINQRFQALSNRIKFCCWQSA